MAATAIATNLATWLQDVGRWLGAETASEFDLARLAEDGLPTGIVGLMTEQGLTSKEVYSIVIPERTLKHRKSRKERLSRDESDKAIRAARLLARAQSIFGNHDKALVWMRQAKQRFGGRTPLDLITTEAGGRVVEEMLIQIDEGMFA
jgi:putative toxin-antitoxin system antitoxin component (TIGR02293 family)